MDEVRMAAVGVGIAVIIAIIIAGQMAVCKFDQAYARGDDKMAKLNGVEIIEMKDGAVTKIKYDGEVYEYTEKFDAREGNIVQNLSVTLDAEIGAFYETDLRGTAIDDEGDSHDDINTYGRTFVKTQETAKVKAGDLIRIVDRFNEFQPYDNGDVFTVSRTYGEGDGDIRVNNNRHFVLEQEYIVINPKEETPQVGDKIRVYDSFISEGNYVDGDVLKVAEILGREDVFAEGVDVGLVRSEFEIVPSDTPVTKGKTEKSSDELTERVDDLEERVGKLETEKDRKPVEGDIVVITGNTNGSANEVGDIGIVTDILPRTGSPCVKVHGRKHGCGCNHTKYSDMRLATAEERAKYYRGKEAQELKVGDYARVTGETLWSDIDEGTVVKVNRLTGSDGEPRIELLDGSDFDFVKPENLEKLDVSARDLSFFRAGRDVGEHEKGDIVRVEDACGSPLIEGNFYEISNNGDIATISLGSIKWRAIVTLVTPVEKRTDIEHDNE